jgi:elongation factor Ts
MTVTAQMVKELREETGAAVLDCKKTLEETQGDIEKAKALLAEKGLAKAKKKMEREAHEGKVETYTHHGGRVGVMVEVNCETDFVAKTERFQEFAHDMALHIAFANPQYLDVEDIPEDVLEEQKEVFYNEAKAQGKPDNVIERIVEGRLNKYFTDVCLLRQPFVKDGEISIGDLVAKAIADLQENIRISRFARFELGGAAPGGEEEA